VAPTRTGYTFGGWYSNSVLTTAFNFDSPITADITLYAKWIQAVTYTVTFNSNNGSDVAPKTVNEGQKADKPANPTKSGFLFDGWYSNSELTTAFDFNTPITQNITLYAKWAEAIDRNVTITYTSGGTLNHGLEFGISSGYSFVAKGGNHSDRLTIIPAQGQFISDFVINGVSSLSALEILSSGNGRYTFSNLTQDMNIHVVFSESGTTSIGGVKKSDNCYGIKFAQNIVSDKAEISVVLPDNERVVEAKIAVYDMTGNVVFNSEFGMRNSGTIGAGSKATTLIVWDLRNNNGRFVANGTYLVVAEVKSASGRVYAYSAKLGVKLR
jgi:uncharacterized repeat protein (TIGR02543 family)